MLFDVLLYGLLWVFYGFFVLVILSGLWHEREQIVPQVHSNPVSYCPGPQVIEMMPGLGQRVFEPCTEGKREMAA